MPQTHLESLQSPADRAQDGGPEDESSVACSLHTEPSQHPNHKKVNNATSQAYKYAMRPNSLAFTKYS